MPEPADPSSDPEVAAAIEAAKAWLERFVAAWNDADIERLRDELHFPHITLGRAGDAITTTTREEFDLNFDDFRANEGWAYSTVEEFTPLSASPKKVHFEALIKRFRTDGTLYGAGRVLYILTEENGHWGMQLRSGVRGFA